MTLQLHQVNAYYGRVQATHELDLVFRQGEVTALLGANGAGKTTTLRAISGLVRTTGQITYDGRRIEGNAPESIAKLGISHVPDNRGTFGGLSVEENLAVGLTRCRNRAEKVRELERVLHLFPRLQQRLKQPAGLLSGGEQQMLAIARALVGRPRMLLLDEPSFGLAPLIVAEIFRILREIRADRGIGIAIVEQNASLALDLADTAYVLASGRVALAGSAAEVAQNDTIKQLYLGI